MSKFEQMLRLWMAGYGVTAEQADKICSNRRMQMNIKQRDGGGVVQDLETVVYECRLFTECMEMVKAFNDPAEKLMLLMVLK